MVPQARQQKDPEPAEVIPDIREYGLPLAIMSELSRITVGHLAYGKAIRMAEKSRKPMTERIKALCNHYGLEGAVMVDDIRLNHYPTTRRVLDPGLLVAAGVPPAVIDACYVTTTSWSFRLSDRGSSEEDE